MDKSKNSLQLTDIKANFCCVLIFLSFTLCCLLPLLLVLPLILAIPCISLLALSKKTVHLIISLTASLIAMVFLTSGDLFTALIMFSFVVLIGVIQTFAIKSNLSALSLTAIFCCSALVLSTVIFLVLILVNNIDFSQIKDMANQVTEAYSLAVKDVLTSSQIADLSPSDIGDLVKSFTLSFKVYFFPLCIVYLEIMGYLSLCVFKGISRIRKAADDTDNNKAEYEYPIPLPLEISKLSAVVFFICYTADLFLNNLQNPVVVALKCMYLIMLPFFVVFGIKYIHGLLSLKTKRPNLICVIICICAVLILQMAAINMIGFFGFWYVMLPDRTKKTIFKQ